MSPHLLLDLELALLEILDKGIVRQRPAQFLVKLPLDTGMLELKGAEMRTIHGSSSLFQAGPSCRIGQNLPGGNVIKP
jgi:hypothetical protein